MKVQIENSSIMKINSKYTKDTRIKDYLVTIFSRVISSNFLLATIDHPIFKINRFLPDKGTNVTYSSVPKILHFANELNRLSNEARHVRRARSVEVGIRIRRCILLEGIVISLDQTRATHSVLV